MTHPYLTGTRHPRVLAHRGLVSVEDALQGIVDNSFAAVAAAHAAGAEYVESDCHLTADGVVVLFHDDDLARVADDPRKIADVTERERAEIMSGRGGLITLAQALDAFPGVRFNLDVKAEDAAEPVGRLVADHVDRVLVTSFSDERRVRALRAASTGTRVPATSAGSATIVRLLLALLVRSDRLVGAALRGLDAVQVPERRGPVRIVSERLIRAAHSHGVEVHVWTVNDTADMTRLLDLDVDGLVTDHADLALRAIAARRPADA